MRLGGTPNHSPISSRRGVYPAPEPYERIVFPSRSIAARAHSASLSAARHSGAGTPRANEITCGVVTAIAFSRLARVGDELRHFGRRRADRDARTLECLLFRLRGSRRAGDDRASVTHRLAGWRREARDVSEDRLRHVLGNVARRFLLLVAADLTDEHDDLGLGIGLESCEHVDERRADDRIAADADDRRVAQPELGELVADLVRERPRARDEPDRALAEDLGR